MSTKKAPYNVVILREPIRDSRDAILEAYLDMLEDCEARDEKYVLMKMFFDEICLMAAREVITRQIQKSAETLEELAQLVDP